jgi:hypothetical protein
MNEAAGVSSGLRIVVGSLVGAACLLTPVPRPSSPLVVVYAIAVCACAVSAIVDELRRQRPVSPLALFALVTLVHFAVPSVLVDVGLLQYANSANLGYSIPALGLAALSLVAFEMGVLLAHAPGRRLASRQVRPVRLSKRAGHITLLLLITGWLVRTAIISAGAYFQIGRGNPDVIPATLLSWVRLLELLPFWATVLLLIEREQGGRVRRLLRGWPLLALVEFAYWAVAGRKEEAILVLALSLVVVWAYRRKLPDYRIIAAALTAIVVLFPASFLYRQSLEALSSTDIRADQLAVLAAKEGLAEGEALAAGADASLQRLNLTESVAASIRLVDQGDWRLRYGSDYVNSLLILVPRVLWQSKPNYHYGNEFGVAAGFIPGSDRLTSISITYLGESFLNFGPFGWLLFILVAAVMTVFFQWVVVSGRVDALVLYLLALPPFLYQGGSSALYFGGFIKLVLVGVALSPVMLHRPRSRVPASRGNPELRPCADS